MRIHTRACAGNTLLPFTSLVPFSTPGFTIGKGREEGGGKAATVHGNEQVKSGEGMASRAAGLALNG